MVWWLRVFWFDCKRWWKENPCFWWWYWARGGRKQLQIAHEIALERGLNEALKFLYPRKRIEEARPSSSPFLAKGASSVVWPK